MRLTPAIVAVVAACSSKHEPPAPAPAAPPVPAPHAPTRVAIAGHVLDAHDQAPVGGVRVILRGPDGELETTTRADGAYAITVPPARYRAYVRGDHVMTVGVPDRVRIDPGPRAAFANRLDETLVPVLDATEDVSDVDLEVERVARLAGRVIDLDSATVAHAVVRATGGPTRPVLGTDIAESNADGEYELRVPEGRYAVDVAHPRYATSQPRLVVVRPATRTTLELDPGCIVTGKVVGAGKAPANDGAIERELVGLGRFGPASKIEPDGTFRFTTLDDGDVVLRAWPWQTAPTEGKTFACHAGARFADVKLATHDAPPDLAGTVVDADGVPVPFVYLDVRPLVGAAQGQQERADAHGRWSVFDMPPGQYEITASVPGRGIAVADVSAPGTGLDVKLTGTGRIAGTTTALVDGTISLRFQSCSDAVDALKHPLQVAHEPRLVHVTGGRFAIDGAPACHLTFVARWHGMEVEASVDVHRDDVATVELALGTPAKKLVTGVVRDASQHAIDHARVTVSLGGKDLDATTTDEDGRFAVHAVPGSELRARDGLRSAAVIVGSAAVRTELVELVIDQ